MCFYFDKGRMRLKLVSGSSGRKSYRERFIARYDTPKVIWLAICFYHTSCHANDQKSHGQAACIHTEQSEPLFVQIPRQEIPERATMQRPPRSPQAKQATLIKKHKDRLHLETMQDKKKKMNIPTGARSMPSR